MYNSFALFSSVIAICFFWNALSAFAKDSQENPQLSDALITPYKIANASTDEVQNIAQALPKWSAESNQDEQPQWEQESSANNQPNWLSSEEKQDAVADSTVSPLDPDENNISEEQIKALERRLSAYEVAPKSWVKPYIAGPSMTLSIPSAFGADRGRFFLGAGASRTRNNTTDGSAIAGIGFGNAQKSVGVQVSYTAVSIGPRKFLSQVFGIGDDRDTDSSSRPFGSGGFNIKVHKQFPNGWSAAVGADGILNVGKLDVLTIVGTEFNELENTFYGVVSKDIPLKRDPNELFSRLTITAGLGTGRFLTLKQAQSGGFHVNPFASVALKVSPAVSVITEWSGNDLGIGASIVPFRRLPIVLTPAIRDIFGPDAQRGPRFVMGVGLGF